MRARLDVDLSEQRLMLTGMGMRARRPERALRSRASLQDLRSSADRRYSRGLRTAGRAWQLEKEQRGLLTSRFEASGDARMAITKGRGPGASAMVFSAYDGELRWGVRRGRSDLYYIQVHASGYVTGHSNRRQDTKARRVVFIDKLAKEQIGRRVRIYVAEDKIVR